MRKFITILTCCFISVTVFSQKIQVVSGSIECLKNEKVIEFSFTYDNMRVGKMTEQEYVTKKTTEFNDKEAGRGDKWSKSWVDDRKNRFQPAFYELFDKHMEKVGVTAVRDGANYRIILNTDFTEPGFNVAVARRNAAINLTATVIEIATGEEVACIVITNSSANNFWGTDFDTGFRIQECYGKAGREFAKFLIKKNKMKG